MLFPSGTASGTLPSGQYLFRRGDGKERQSKERWQQKNDKRIRISVADSCRNESETEGKPPVAQCRACLNARRKKVARAWPRGRRRPATRNHLTNPRRCRRRRTHACAGHSKRACLAQKRAASSYARPPQPWLRSYRMGCQVSTTAATRPAATGAAAGVAGLSCAAGAAQRRT